MNTITIKWIAFIAIALLILGTFSPVLQVRAQADDRRRDGNESTEPVLTEEEAIVLALEFLRAEIGNNEFVVEKVQIDDGDYELRISDSDSRYEITLDGKTGEILDFEVKTDDDVDEDEEEANAPSITTPIISEDDAISAAVEALPGPFEEGVDIIERIQLNDDGNYKLRILHQGIEYDILINGENGEVLKFTIRGNGNGRDNEKVENVDPSPLIQANDAIETALAYLLGIDPTKDYEVDSIEVDNGNYQIKLRDGEQKYELLIDGQNGEVLEFEVKGQDDEEEEDEDRERVELLVTLGLQEAIQIALDFLEARDPDFFAKTYTVVEAELKGLKYKIEISVEGDQFEFDIDAKDGRITKFDEDRGEIELQLELEEDQETPSITLEQAIEAALAYLISEFPGKEFVVEEVEQDDGNYKIEVTDGETRYKITIHGQESTIIEFEIKEGRPGRAVGLVGENPPNGPPMISIDLQEAIQIALDFLEARDPDFFAKTYTVVEAELNGLKYKIEIIESANEFEFKIDATDGTIREFEMEVEDAELEIEEDDESELKIKVKERGDDEEKNAFNLNVGKQQARLTTNFNIREEGIKSQLELQLQFTSLEEFLDGEGDGFLSETDTVLRTINLNRLSWTVTREEIMDEEGDLQEIIVIQAGSSEGLERIAFIYHLTPTTREIVFADESVASVKVWEVKFDIEISGFDWSDPESLLALTARFNSQFKVKTLGDSEVRFEVIDKITPFFNWSGDAAADGDDIDVMAVVNERVITLSYPHFEDELIHDPSIGYIVSSILEAIVLVPMVMAVGAIIAVTAVLGSSLLRQERLRKRLEESL